MKASAALVLLLALAASCCALSALAVETSSPDNTCSLTVELRVLSGGEQPRWQMGLGQATLLLQRLAHFAGDLQPAAELTHQQSTNHRLGYHGMLVESDCDVDTWKDLPLRPPFFIGNEELITRYPRTHQLLFSSRNLELTLFKSMPLHLVQEAVIDHVLQRIESNEQHISRSNGNLDNPATNAGAMSATIERIFTSETSATNPHPAGRNDDCGQTKEIAPDNPEEPDAVPPYKPNEWNGGDKCQYSNNCYNYGTDVRTNTFAQPGRGSGHKWEYNTCESVTEAASRDGLVPLPNITKSDDLPQPIDNGHYIALVMWPDVNFHWYRLDSGGMWSNKHGGTAASDLDERGEPIADPKDASRSPYTTFCGYLKVVPTQVADTIN